jgi:hypothetical protein
VVKPCNDSLLALMFKSCKCFKENCSGIIICLGQKAMLLLLFAKLIINKHGMIVVLWFRLVLPWMYTMHVHRSHN